MSLFKATQLSNQEWDTHLLLKYALEHARNRRTVRGVRELLGHRAAIELAAVNWRARERFGRALCDRVSAQFNLAPPAWHSSMPTWFFTLVDQSCNTDDDADVSLDVVHRFKRFLRRGLQGLHYVGMLEPALYVNVYRRGPNGKKSFISWHVHGICWGADSKEIRRRVKAMNSDKYAYRPVIGELTGAHCRRIPRGHLPDKLRYMLKAPRKEYRVYKSRGSEAEGTEPRFRQRKQTLRPGNRIKLFHLLKRLHLDGLALAGGDGVRLLKETKQTALYEYTRHEAEDRARRAWNLRRSKARHRI